MFFIFKIHQLGGNDTLYGAEVSKAHLSVAGGGFQTKHFGFVGSMVKQFLLFVLHFLSVLAFVYTEGFIKRWQWMMRGAKGEINRPSHSLSSL